jgi:hypothetical protein
MDCSDLKIRLPEYTNIEALELLASQFEANASRSVFRGCVGALDGLTVLIKARLRRRRMCWPITLATTSMIA